MRRAAIIVALTSLRLFASDEPRGPMETEGVRLAGTTWMADDGPLGRVSYYFDKSGLLVYTYANGAEYRNGTWKQVGDKLYLEQNQGYREFRATLRAERIIGKSWNKAGNTWTTTLTLKRR